MTGGSVEGMPDDLAREILDRAVEGCQLLGPDFRIRYANDAAARHLRTPRDQLIGRPLMEAVAGLESALPFTALQRCMQERASLQKVVELSVADGSAVWLELHVVPVPAGLALLSLDVTELERSQQVLQRSADRWRSTFDAITDIVCVITKQHTFAEINRAGCTALGLPREQIIGRPCFELVHRTRSPIPGCPCNETMRTQEPAKGVHEQDGRSYELTSWPLPAADGELEGFVHLVEDITERRRAEQELTLFRRLVDRSNDAIEVLDPTSGRILDVNERACHDLGYDRDEYLSLTVFDIDPMVDRATFAQRLPELRQSGSLVHEGIHRRRDGTTFPVEVAVQHVRLDRDYLVAVSRDITQRRAAEEALRRSRDAQEAVASILRLSLEELELDELLARILHRVLSVSWLQAESKGAILLVDDDRDGLVLRAAEGLPDELIQRCTSQHLGACLCGRSVESGQLVHDCSTIGDDERARDATAPHGHHCVPIAYAGEVLGVLSVYLEPGHRQVRDETDFLTDVANTIAGIIVRRKAAEERRRVEEQLKLAQRLEAVGRLAGGVAHDFNNLLSVIINYSDFALEELRRADPVRADIEEVHQAGKRAAALTRQLLAFSRKQVMQLEVLSLNKVVADFEGMLRRLLGEDIEIAIHLAENLGSVEADPGQLEQVILNLAVNARDAMPRGGRLTIETANVDVDEAVARTMAPVQAGSFVVLSVTDTGCGMDESTQQHAFEPFFTTKGQGKGTGLGLPTVHGVVKQSGGEVRVDSAVDRGTKFEVYLPRVDGSPAGRFPAPPSLLPRGTETVLVVEDEQAVRNLVERMLRSAGYQVISVGSGGDALLYCEKHPRKIDLLVTDVVMPQVSGPELWERLERICPGLPVLYMSGYTDDAVGRRGVLKPDTHLMSKPFSAASLCQKVREVLDARLGRIETGRDDPGVGADEDD